MLAPGTKAPDFILNDQAEARIRLAAYHGKYKVVFFYPADNSAGCTREACAFRDSYAEFRELGAVVLGISQDDSSSHEAFRKKHELPYPLLSDPGGAVARDYGVPRPLGFMRGRATFVIDKGGVVRMAHSNLLDSESHRQKALEAVRELAEAEQKEADHVEVSP